jgi:hypothetical protein
MINIISSFYLLKYNSELNNLRNQELKNEFLHLLTFQTPIVCSII